MVTETSLPTFDDFDGRINIVFNPVASSIAEASARPHDVRYMLRELGALSLAFPHRINLIPTATKTTETYDILLDELEEGDIIVSAGGDGLMHLIINFLRRDPQLDSALRNTPVVPIYGGNSNLTASELNPKLAGMRPHIVDIFRDGVIIDAYGSTTTVTSNHPDETGPDIWENVSCHSIEIGGIVGNALSSVKGNALRRTFLRTAVDTKAVVRAAKGLDPIPMKINGEEVETIGSIGVICRPYLKHVNTPASLADPAFYELTLTSNTIAYLTKAFVKNKFGNRIPWRRVERGQGMVYELTSQPGQQLYAEGDAEAHELPVQDDSETHITVETRPSDLPNKMFSTNPKLVELTLANQ